LSSVKGLQGSLVGVGQGLYCPRESNLWQADRLKPTANAAHCRISLAGELSVQTRFIAFHTSKPATIRQQTSRCRSAGAAPSAFADRGLIVGWALCYLG